MTAPEPTPAWPANLATALAEAFVGILRRPLAERLRILEIANTMGEAMDLDANGFDLCEAAVLVTLFGASSANHTPPPVDSRALGLVTPTDMVAGKMNVATVLAAQPIDGTVPPNLRATDGQGRVRTMEMLRERMRRR